ncbi:flagellar brake domain-containing protein [Agarivorans aestuarii]|uniref:flagellar brake domain-containing protein n=1 Tax=Agarivorans aestuarii TaxID=1563703 RepID=UPI001C7E5E85|nr:flagellar brake protein [Agarivorans aestuarii]
MAPAPSPRVNQRQEVVDIMRQLRFGDVLDVQFVKVGNVRVKCKLIGLDDANFLIFAVPKYAQQGHGDVLVEGMACVIRSIIEGEAGQCIAFRSIITDIIKSPKHLLFVKYPSEVERFSLRKQQRASTRIPATVTHRSSVSDQQIENDLSFDGIILDLSAGGCRFKMAWPESNGKLLLDSVFVYIRIPGKPENDTVIEGNIKSQSRDGHNHIAVGIKFEGATDLDELFAHLALDV